MVKKHKDGGTKSRVARVDTVVSLPEQSHECLYTVIVGETQLQTVYGNML